MRIYVGNLSLDVSDEDLAAAFRPFGQVDSAQVITDRFSGRSRGFGFVEMPNSAEAQASITALNGKELKGRAIVVNEARARGAGGDRRAGDPRDRRGGGRRF